MNCEKVKMPVASNVPTDAPTARPDAMDRQAAAEIAQELMLVTKSLFAQLLPSTSAHAVSGVPGLGSPSQVAADTQAARVQGQPIATAATAAAPTAVPVPEAPAAGPATAPVPSVPVPQAVMPALGTQTTAPALPETPRPIPMPTPATAPQTTAPSESPEQHPLALLEEIGFLDE